MSKTFEVTGKLARPGTFEKKLYKMILKHSPMRISARRVGLDELARRRGETEETLEFEFQFRELFHDGGKFFIGGHRLDNGDWLRIDVGDNGVQFETYTSDEIHAQ